MIVLRIITNYTTRCIAYEMQQEYETTKRNPNLSQIINFESKFKVAKI